MATQPRAYKSQLRPNARKLAMLNDTFDLIERGSNVFFKFFINLFGGLTPEIATQYCAPPKKTKDEEVVVTDIGLLCAINWFRVVKKDKSEIPQPTLPKMFTKYFGSEPSKLVLEYLNANIDGEKYSWIDCRERYLSFCRSMKIAPDSLRIDLKTMFHEKILLLEQGEINAWAACSTLFGMGDKEDRDVKIEILSTIYESVLAAEPSTRSELNEIILRGANAQDSKQFKANYAGKAGGRDNFLMVSLTNTSDVFTQPQFKSFCENCKKALKGKGKKIELPNIAKIKAYLEGEIGRTFEIEPWSQMWMNALVCVQPKNTRNYTFAVDQLSSFDELSKLDSTHVNKLNAFFDSEYFKSTDRFLIKSSHLNKLQDFYKYWDLYKDSESVFEDSISDFEDHFVERPITTLLNYIFSIRTEVTAAQLLESAKCNFLTYKHESQSVHPSVLGGISINYGNSAMKGIVIDPKTKFQENHLGDPAHFSLEYGCKIWTDLNLLDGDKWTKHHLPFFNTRFLEEVYAYNPNSENTVQIRTKRFGYQFKYEHKDKINCADASKVKVVKRLKKIMNTPDFPNVDWNSNSCSFGIKKIDGKFVIFVNYKLKEDICKDKKAKIGTKILSFDQNQTANHTYALMEVTLESPTSKLFCDLHVNVLDVGDITSNTKIKDKVIDQLSYPGIHKSTELFKEWRQQRRNFANTIPLAKQEEIDQRKSDKKKLPEVFADTFDTICNIEYLYAFNAKYARMLTRVLRSKRLPLIEMRSEIIAFLTGRASILRLSSLNNTSFDAIRAAKSLVNSYLDFLVGKTTAESEREEADPELYSLLKKAENKRVNKGKEKVNRCYEFILNKATQEKVNIIVGEGNLPTANKKNKKSHNSKNVDWLARALCNKLDSGVKIHNIYFYQINPFCTSHMDPFEHNKDSKNPVSCMRARFNQEPPNKILDWQMKAFSTLLKIKDNDARTTSKYYRDAMNEFISHYKLEEFRERLRLNKIPFFEFQKIIQNKIDSLGETVVVYPRRGGRVYLATHQLTKNAVEISYNQKKFWLSNADEIAAINIGLQVLNPKTSKASPIERSSAT